MQKIYSVKLNRLLRNFIATNAVVGIILYTFNTQTSIILYTSILITAYYTGHLLFIKRPVRITINQSEKSLIITFARIARTVDEEYKIYEISSLHQREVVSRLGKADVLTLFDRDGKVILKLIPNVNGWAAEDLEAIHRDLIS